MLIVSYQRTHCYTVKPKIENNSHLTNTLIWRKIFFFLIQVQLGREADIDLNTIGNATETEVVMVALYELNNKLMISDVLVAFLRPQNTLLSLL